MFVQGVEFCDVGLRAHRTYALCVRGNDDGLVELWLSGI